MKRENGDSILERKGRKAFVVGTLEQNLKEVTEHVDLSLPCLKSHSTCGGERRLQ